MTTTPSPLGVTQRSTETARWGHWIAGGELAPSAGQYFPSVNPADGRAVALIADGDAGDVDRAVTAAQAALPEWSALPPLERSRLLMSLSAAIRENQGQLDQLERSETGKLNASAEISYAADYFEFYSGVLRALTGEVIDVGPGAHAFTRREPWGVIGVITPWNAPLNQAAREVAPALAAGNTAVVKPAEATSTTTLFLGRLAKEAGLPDGVLNVITGDGPGAGAPLVDHPLVRKLAFTGSVATGRRVAEAAARRLIPVTLELGGKSPNIIFADGDLTRAAAAATRAFTGNTGQVCSAGTRMIVERSAHDQILAAVADTARALVPGKHLGPLITSEQYAKVNTYFNVAREDGATLVTGGPLELKDDLSDGFWVQPTIYSGVTSDMRIAREEIFGPVLAVLPFDDEDEAVRIANDTEHGLVAGVWTTDVSRALRVSAKLQAGNVYVNGWGAPLDVPFGGYKSSGYGREKGFEALRDFTQLKSVVVHGL
jgi:aldehyde dehydrogenase (NAD+)